MQNSSGISVPSNSIDSAICDLLIAISQFSDEFFDAYWLNLTDKEIEFLVVGLIKTLTEDLQGQALQLLLLQIRQEETEI